MGKKLETIFAYLEAEGGQLAVMRATVISKIPRARASILEDSEETVEKLQDAVKKILNRTTIPGNGKRNNGSSQETDPTDLPED